MSSALRLVVFDATQAERRPRALGLAWKAGARLYRMPGYLDASYGARSFGDAFDWLGRIAPDRPIAEVQFWGHGRWGRALIDRESFDRTALSPHHPLRPRLEAVRQRLSSDALIWFRTCETLGADTGRDFAAALGDFMGASVAGHTFIIGFFQSGLHRLRPGMLPGWPADEGLARGTANEPHAALSSRPGRPNTITCLTHRVPSHLA